MLRRNCEKIACDMFYGKLNLPGKMQYIERVMDSCQTEEHLETVKVWGNSVLTGILRMVDRAVNSKYGSGSDFIYITGKFSRNLRKIRNEINAYYKVRLDLIHEAEKKRNEVLRELSEPNKRDGGVQEGA